MHSVYNLARCDIKHALICWRQAPYTLSMTPQQGITAWLKDNSLSFAYMSDARITDVVVERYSDKYQLAIQTTKSPNVRRWEPVGFRIAGSANQGSSIAPLLRERSEKKLIAFCNDLELGEDQTLVLVSPWAAGRAEALTS